MEEYAALIYQTTQHHITENNLLSLCLQNLKLQKIGKGVLHKAVHKILNDTVCRLLRVYMWPVHKIRLIFYVTCKSIYGLGKGNFIMGQYGLKSYFPDNFYICGCPE
jgi:hypothetical protein